LPVLTRGADDQGVFSQPTLIPPFPTLETISVPNNKPGIHLGQVLTLSGHHLAGDSVKIRFMNPHLEEAIEVSALPGGTETEITVQVPDEPANWPAGFYSLAAVISKTGEQVRTTNEMPLMLSPQITGISIAPLSPPNGRYTATANCSPQVLPDQSAALLLGSREFPVQDHPVKTGILTFSMANVPDGEYYVRLRIDGVDSLLIDRSVTPPVFDATQKVTIP
jgi:hypothetical protein